MINPKRKFLGFTWVGWLNILLFQWLFVRLAYGDRWRVLKWILPLTGWWSDYRYIGKHV